MNWYKIAKEEQLDLFSKNPPPPTMPKETTPEPLVYCEGVSSYNGAHWLTFVMDNVKRYRYFMDIDDAKRIKKQCNILSSKGINPLEPWAEAQRICTSEQPIDMNGNPIIKNDGSAIGKDNRKQTKLL